MGEGKEITMKIFIVILLTLIAITSEAQEIGKSYQLSLLGLRQTDNKEDNGKIAVVVSNRTVIRHYKSAPQQIQQLKKQFGGGKCGCGH